MSRTFQIVEEEKEEEEEEEEEMTPSDFLLSASAVPALALTKRKEEGASDGEGQNGKSCIFQGEET